jgi:DNA-binding XRE family transcriptional regulator
VSVTASDTDSPLSTRPDGWAALSPGARGQIARILAANVRSERERAALTQDQLARATLFRRSTIQRIEYGTTEARLTTLFAFSVALDVPLVLFLEGMSSLCAATQD